MAIIALSSPRKGQGQTSTGINVAALMKKEYGKDILFVDTNQLCKDVDYYLSDSHITKGLDEFLNYLHTEKMNTSNFNKCMKDTKFGLKIMSSNKCILLENNDITSLMEYANDSFMYTFIDTAHTESNVILSKADIILVVINQIDLALEMINNNQQYASNKEKIIFVVNRYIKKSQGIKISYTSRVIKSILKKYGYGRNEIFTLAHDPRLINDCNEQRLLNFIETNGKAQYVSDLKMIIQSIHKKLEGGEE